MSEADVLPDSVPTREQHKAARVVGSLYLLLMVTGLFAEFYARGSLIVAGDAVQTARNIAASERLFRLGIVFNLITFTGDVALVWALYVVLRSVNRNIAVLAVLWRLAECAILGITALNDFIALRLLSGADFLRVFDVRQLQALARLFISAEGAGYMIGMVFFGLGSAVFGYLWLQSRYIPRALAWWGIIASLIMTVVIMATMIFPKLDSIVTPAYFVPIMFFEITLGFWLLVKGLRAPSA